MTLSKAEKNSTLHSMFSYPFSNEHHYYDKPKEGCAEECVYHRRNHEYSFSPYKALFSPSAKRLALFALSK